jgi:hypothetical protein
MGSKDSSRATSFNLIAFIAAGDLVPSTSTTTAYGPNNGVYWYYYQNHQNSWLWGSVGFASSSSISLDDGGDKSNEDCTWRLSWYLNPGGYSWYGWRSGCAQGMSAYNHQKVMYSCAGAVRILTALTQCFDCVPGKFLATEGNDAATDCVPCAAGTYSTTSGASSNSTCIACAAGTYSAAGVAVCIACTAGTYSETVGASSNSTCIACAKGTYLATEGNDAATDCVPCAQSSIDMYNNDVGKKSAQKIMKQTGDLKAATLYFAS